MITAWWGTHYGMDVPFDPFDIIDLVAAWILFIWFGVIWYKIDRQKNLARRFLSYLNFFIIFPCLLFLTFWLQGFWVPLPLMLIIFYAIAVLVRHYAIKRPLATNKLGVWTVFLMICFISMILEVTVFLPSQYWNLDVIMLGAFVYAVYFTRFN